MSKLTKRNNLPFTQIANVILNHPTLSLKAKGLYAFMFSKPDNWNFTASSMASQLKESKSGILTILRELKDFGLLLYTKHSDGHGTYHLSLDFPSENPEKQPKVETTSLPKNSQSVKLPPRQIASKAKSTPINNKDTSSNKEISNNTPITPKWLTGGGKNKSSSLELPRDIASYRKKVINSGLIGKIGLYDVELKYECVYIDAMGHLYTDTRTSKQLLSSTIKELWIQIYNEVKSIQNNQTNMGTSQKQLLSNTLATLTQNKSL